MDQCIDLIFILLLVMGDKEMTNCNRINGVIKNRKGLRIKLRFLSMIRVRR